MATALRVFFVLLITVNVGHGQEYLQSDRDVQRSGRIIADILEMFAPERSESERRQRPPYGINRRMTEEERLGAPSTSNLRRQSDTKEWSSLAQEVMKMFTTSTTPAPTTTSSGIFGNLADRFKIPGVFKSLFNSDEDQVTTTTLPPSTLFPTFPTLPPFPSLFTTSTTTEASVFNSLKSIFDKPRPSSQTDNNFANLFAISTTTEASVFNGLKSIFDKPRPGSQIDTGKMDRFIVREHATDPEDFWSNIVGNRFNERGVKWEDGNLKFVNKNGNRLLGSDVAVHDRSIDIPVQRWFDIASDMFQSASRQRQNAE